MFETQTPLVVKFVIPLGLEPKTYSLEGCCSIQLSYGTKPLFAKSATNLRFRLQIS